MAAKQFFGSIWRRLALVNAGLHAAAFEPMHAQIKWIQSPNREFVLSPISNSPLAADLPEKLTITDIPETMYPSKIPHFTAKPDQTIIWDATGWCIEAAGKADGAEVRLNRCTSGPNQLWDCLPQTKQIRLKGTSSCLHVNDEVGLNGAPFQLRTCDSVASWEFSDSEPLLERTALSYTRHVLILLLSSAALGLFFGVWWWKQLAKTNHTITRIPSDMDQSGVSLSVPLDGHQGSLSSILSLESREQKMVPAVMTLNPSQMKQRMAPAATISKMIRPFEVPSPFGRALTIVDDENKGLGSRPQVKKSNGRVLFPHFEYPRALGLTPIMVDEENDEYGKGLGSRPQVQESNGRVKFPHFEDPRAFGLTPIMVDDENDDYGKGHIRTEQSDDESPVSEVLESALHDDVEKGRALKTALDSFKDDIQNVLHEDLTWDVFADDFRVIGETGEVAMDLATSQWHTLLVRAICLHFIVKEKIDATVSLTPDEASNPRDTFVNTHSKFQFGNRKGDPFPWFWQEADPIEVTMEASFHFNRGNLIDYMQIHVFLVNGLPLNNFPKLKKSEDFAVNVKSLVEWMNGIKLHDLRPWWTPFASYLTNIKSVGDGNYANVYLMDEICPPSTVPITIAMKELVPNKSPAYMIRNEIEAMKSLGDFVRSDANIRRQKLGTTQDFSPYCEPLLAEPKEQDGRIYLPLPFYNMGEFEHIYENPDKRQALGGDKGMYALMLHVARGVKALHGAGWAHHDLHGYNVMISSGSGKSLAEVHASVIDFGLATRLDEPSKGPRGMLHCQAPEMQTSFSSDKRKMDVWSLGMLLWEIRFGWESLPLENLSMDEAKKRLVTLDFKNADDLPALEGEPEIANLLSGMLTANPCQRWHLDRVIEELEKIAHPEMLGPHESPLVNAGALSDKLAPASRDPPMDLGFKVALVGMAKAAHLNGLTGTIVGHDESRKLYKVQLDQGEDVATVDRPLAAVGHGQPNFWGDSLAVLSDQLAHVLRVDAKCTPQAETWVGLSVSDSSYAHRHDHAEANQSFHSADAKSAANCFIVELNPPLTLMLPVLPQNSVIKMYVLGHGQGARVLFRRLLCFKILGETCKHRF